MNLITPFRWYENYYEQDRYDNDCDRSCAFKLFTSVRQLLPFQFDRPKSPYKLTNFILRPACNDPLLKMFTHNEANFVNLGRWQLNQWTIAAGVAKIVQVGSIPLANKVQMTTILTVGKKYTFRIYISHYDSVNMVFSVSNGPNQMIQVTDSGVYEMSFTAMYDDISFNKDFGVAGESITVDYFQVYEDFTIYTGDIALPNSAVKLFNGGDRDYFVYCGSDLTQDIPCGDYIAIIRDESGKLWYSEVVTFKDFIPERSEYYKLEWYNSCDLNNIVYQNHGCPYKNWIYLDATISKPENPFTETLEEDGNGIQNPTFQKWQKKQVMTLPICPEFIVDSLSAIRLHDNVNLYKPLRKSQDIVGDPVKILSMEFDSKPVLEDCFNTIEMKILLDENIMDETCCKNIVEPGCLTCNYTVPDVNVIDTSYGYALTISFIGWVYGLHHWDGVQWNNFTPPAGTVVCTTIIDDSGFPIYYYFDGVLYKKTPFISSVTLSGSTFTVQGTAYPGTFVTIQYALTTPTGWTTVNGIYTAAQFAAGIVTTFTGLSPIPCCDDLYIRVRDFSLKCEFGYSNYYLMHFNACC